MTNEETVILVGFLCAGAVLGIVGSWMDQVLSFIRR